MVNVIRKIVFLSVVLFSSTAYCLTMDWVTVGNVNNQADSQTGYGSVGYEYKISTCEVTYTQYIEFLSAVATTDANGLYNTKMTTKGGINRSGSSGSYTYSLKSSAWANRPINFVDWYSALRFVNWMNNGQPVGLQDGSTTETGAYDMALGVDVVRSEDALYALPNKDEFYKAAYYDPVNNVYYDYAMGSDATPNNHVPSGDTGNSANFWSAATGYIIPDYGTSPVGAYDESESPYGTYDQNGNVWEWSEDTYGGNVYLYGGSCSSGVGLLASSYGGDLLDPTLTYATHGFRLVTDFTHEDVIPEPSTIILLCLGLISGLLKKRK